MALASPQKETCNRCELWSSVGFPDSVCFLQFVDKFSEAKEAARKAMEERKQGGKSDEPSSSPELKPVPHQTTPTSPPAGSEEGRGEGGAGKVMVNGESSAGQRAGNTSSAEVTVYH